MMGNLHVFLNVVDTQKAVIWFPPVLICEIIGRCGAVAVRSFLPFGIDNAVAILFQVIGIIQQFGYERGL